MRAVYSVSLSTCQLQDGIWRVEILPVRCIDSGFNQLILKRPRQRFRSQARLALCWVIELFEVCVH